MKDEDRKLSDKEFEEKYKNIALAPYRRVRLEEKRKQREKTEAEEQKIIEESKALEKEQRKEELLEKVVEVLSGSEWLDRIITFIRNAVSNSETEMVTMFLVREKGDVWSFEAILGMKKPKGINYIKVDFGNEP